MFDRSMPRAAFFTTPRRIGLAVIIAIGLAVLAGASLVAAQRGEPGEPPSAESYQGCVNTYTGVLRIVGDGEQCQDHETPIQLGGAGDAELQERIDELERENDALEERVETLETNQVTLPACLTTEAVDSQERDDIVFEGCNVHVRSGAGATDAAVNGLGNLIIGYNEREDDDERAGSHNLVVGPTHSYTSYGGLVAGSDNTIRGVFSSVTGGRRNTASGANSSVSGGSFNTASNAHSSVTGGWLNTASGVHSSVTGGQANRAIGEVSNVSGGSSNTANADQSSVTGGFGNTATGIYSSLTGGHSNTAGGDYSSVSGGQTNIAGGDYSSVGGGIGLIADDTHEFLPFTP